MANLNNGAYSTLASGITAGATSLSVASGEGARFPSSNFYISVYDSRYPNWAVAYRAGAGEIMLCSSRTTDALTVTRAQGGTSAVAFNTTGVTYRVENNLVAENISGLSGDYVALTGDQTVAGTKTFSDNIKVGSPSATTGSIIFFNATDNYTANLIVPDSGLTTSTAYTLPNASGTVALTSDAKTLIKFGGVVAPSLTRYADPMGVSAKSNNYEGQIAVGAGVIRNLRVSLLANAGVTSYVITVQLNGVDTALTCSRTGSGVSTVAVSSDITHSFASASNDLIGIKVVTSTNGGFTPSQCYYSVELCGA